MKFNAVYVEITNVCNLHCSFCPGTKRKPHFLSCEEFELIADKVKSLTDYIYLHVMGEPLLHPELEKILDIANAKGLTVNITTNGTLLAEKADVLLSAKNLRKVAVSLHSFEGNRGTGDIYDYLDNVMKFLRHDKCITELRLWNGGGENMKNDEIINYFSKKLNIDISSLPERNGSKRLGKKCFLVNAEKFDWPSYGSDIHDTHHCHALQTHFAVLSTGEIVPCCLDGNAGIVLGNIFTDVICDVISSPRAQNMIKGFMCGKPSEELCRRCGYAERFG